MMKLALVATLAVAVVAARTISQDAPKVKVDFYTESLCPGCLQFSTQTLAPALKSIGSIIDFHLYAYGNAQTDPKTGKITCQHGELECQLNVIEDCAIHYGKDSSVWWPYVLCVDENPSMDTAKSCLKSTGMPEDKIMDCFNGPLGDKLHHIAGNKTDALKPPHQYTPWVVINDKPLGTQFDTFVQTVCDAYTGPKPAGCSSTNSIEVCLA